MSSVALPFTTKTSALSAEGDLVAGAARGDRPAFDELYRRHATPAWRLAIAVAADRDRAEVAVAEGFVRALRMVRRRHSQRDVFRAHLLSGVYRTVLEQVRRTTTSESFADVPDDASPLTSAFLGLPERWRAALWLTDVEGFDPLRVGVVLDVSGPVATQLADRGRRSLASRLAQSDQPVPTSPTALAASLQPMAAVIPASLEEHASARWRRLIAIDPATRFAPVNLWLGDRAQRTLGVAAAGLLALGVIGVGVLGQGTGVGTSPTVASPPLAGSYNGLAVHGPAALQQLHLVSSGPAGFVLNGPLDQVVVSNTTGQLAATTRSSRPATGAGHTRTSRTGTSKSKTTTGHAPKPSSAPQPSTPAPLVNVPGVATVSSGSGGTNVTLLPKAAGGGVGVTLCPTGVDVTLLGTPIDVGCPASAPAAKAKSKSSSTSSSGSSSSNPVSSLLHDLGGLL